MSSSGAPPQPDKQCFGLIRRVASAGRSPASQKTQTLSGQLVNAEMGRSATAPSGTWSLTWSHYLFLMGIQNPDERCCYEHGVDALGREGQLLEKPQQAGG